MYDRVRENRQRILLVIKAEIGRSMTIPSERSFRPLGLTGTLCGVVWESSGEPMAGEVARGQSVGSTRSQSEYQEAVK
jgi:hypothetical protein